MINPVQVDYLLDLLLDVFKPINCIRAGLGHGSESG
jgi:hypothetical protein